MSDEKPNVDDFRRMVTAFFAVRRTNNPAEQDSAYEAFQQVTFVGLWRSHVAPALPVDPVERTRYIDTLEGRIEAIAERWAFQTVMTKVYTGDDSGVARS